MARSPNIGIVITLALLLRLTPLQAEPVDFEHLLDESTLTNLDRLAAPALAGLDQEQVRALCRELQSRLQGEHVVELAPLRAMTSAVLPLLQQDEELRPYAAWLRARLDYLAVADELRVVIPAPRLELSPPQNQSPDLERRLWEKRLKEIPEFPNTQMYVPKLKAAFAAEGVPTELVWVAEVESGFDPRAMSPTGAAGLFQLMPDTARMLGLTIAPHDQRLDPELSARGTARYLRYLFEKFGDWQLVVAAYNAGEGRVRRLLEKHRARRYDEIVLELPAETQMYVPKVQATIQRREGVALADLRPPRTIARESG